MDAKYKELGLNNLSYFVLSQFFLKLINGNKKALL